MKYPNVSMFSDITRQEQSYCDSHICNSMHDYVEHIWIIIDLVFHSWCVIPQDILPELQPEQPLFSLLSMWHRSHKYQYYTKYLS